MSLQAYQLAQQTVETPRQTEYRLFARVTSALMNADASDYPNYAKAIDWNRRLWLTLQTDCADSANRLPESVRAGIISLGIWVEKHSRKAAKRQADLQPLIEVNRIIMEGLAGTAPAR